MESRIRAAQVEMGKKWRELMEAEMYKAPPDYVEIATPPEPDRPKVSTEDLEKLLVALEDGVTGYGRGDCDLLCEIVCELIERRQKEAKDGNKMYFRGAEIKFDRTPDLNQQFWQQGKQLQELEQKVRLQQQLQEKAERYQKEHEQQLRYFMPPPPDLEKYERLRGLQYKGRPAEFTWTSDPASDNLVFRAPDGSKLYSVSGLAQMQMGKSWPDEKRKIEKREKARWLAEKGADGFKGLQGLYT